jgi:glucosamine-6-phosphate deaminase
LAFLKLALIFSLCNDGHSEKEDTPMIKTTICESTKAIGKVAAETAIEYIIKAIDRDNDAAIITATGASQFNTLAELVADNDVDWSKVTMFHLDEYVGMPITHKASFRKYLNERFIDPIGCLKAAHLINADGPDPVAECQRLKKIISQHEIAVAIAGIGENGHLAFNDPPADFETEEPYLVVDLDERCRQQQRGEGWFETFNEVPKQAISMSIRQIMKSQCLILSVPDERKAEAVRNTLTQTVSPDYPASIVQQHPNCYLYLDRASATLLDAVKI